MGNTFELAHHSTVFFRNENAVTNEILVLTIESGKESTIPFRLFFYIKNAAQHKLKSNYCQIFVNKISFIKRSSMKLKNTLYYILFFLPSLLAGQLEIPYTFYKKNGDTLQSKQLSVTLTLDKKVDGFKVKDTRVKIENLIAFSIQDDYYGLNGRDNKGNLNLFKRYWKGKEIQLFYKNKIENISPTSTEIVSKKSSYYRKGTGSIRPLRYENVKIDLGVWTDKKNSTPFDSIERIRKLRKLNTWLIIGAMTYSIIQLDRKRKLTPWMALPPVLLSFTLLSNNREQELLERIIKESY